MKRWAVLSLTVVLMSCGGSAFTQATPSAIAIAEFLQVVCTDPAVDQALDQTGQTSQDEVSSICLSEETQALFSSLEEMAPNEAKASLLAERLRTGFRAVPLHLDDASLSNASRESGLRVQGATTCIPQTGTARLWVAVSPVIRNPYSTSVGRLGFFADVQVESAPGFVVERFGYWIEIGENAESRRPEVSQVVRIATGLDRVSLERVRLLP